MKRLFNKAKRQDSHTNGSGSAFPPTASTPSSDYTAGTPPPPPAGSASPHPHPHSGAPSPGSGHLQQQHQQGYHPQQQQQQFQYGPDGQAYMLVPVPVGMAQGGQQQGYAVGPGGMARGGGGRGAGGLPRPPRVQEVGNAIGWSCAMPTFDWGYVLALADHLSQGGDPKKKGPAEEAAKALRKEFKHATPTAQERAVKLTFLLARNSDTKFRQQIASKKFSSAVQDLVNRPETDPRVKDMVFRVLSPLAFEYQDDPTLSPLSTLFAKLLPALSTYPTSLDPSSASLQPSGAPLSESDPLLRPEGLLTNSSSRNRRREGGGGAFPSSVEQMRDLRRRAVEGKEYAGMLQEAVAGVEREGRVGEVEGDEIVQEFYHQTLSAQEFLSTNLEWASVQAEQSRARKEAEQQQGQQQQGPETGADEWTDVEARERAQARADEEVREGKTTEEEDIFAELLAASTEISDALHHYHRLLTSHTRTQQEDADLAAAFERSRAETRFDRFGAADHLHAHEAERSHDYGEGGSGAASGAGSPNPLQPQGGYAVDEEITPVPVKADKGKGRVRTSLNPYASYMEDASRSSSPAAFGASPPPPVASAASGDNGHEQRRGDESQERAEYHPQHHPATTATAAAAADDPYGGLDAFAEGLSLSDRGHGQGANGVVQNGHANYAAPSGPPQQPHFSSSNPYAALSLSNSHPASHDSYSPSAAAAAASPFDDPSPAAFSASAGASSPLDPPTGTTESAFLREFVPEGPSEKALGKLRRVSVRENSMDAAQQQQRLEEALREKYHRNYEEEQERRRSPL
ncbi:hypothetical protein JCM6882_008615 [Rhodosporidiobolus microsporus]